MNKYDLDRTVQIGGKTYEIASGFKEYGTVRRRR